MFNTEMVAKIKSHWQDWVTYPPEEFVEIPLDAFSLRFFAEIGIPAELEQSLRPSGYAHPYLILGDTPDKKNKWETKININDGAVYIRRNEYDDNHYANKDLLTYLYFRVLKAEIDPGELIPEIDLDIEYQNYEVDRLTVKALYKRAFHIDPKAFESNSDYLSWFLDFNYYEYYTGYYGNYLFQAPIKSGLYSNFDNAFCTFMCKGLAALEQKTDTYLDQVIIPALKDVGFEQEIDKINKKYPKIPDESKKPVTIPNLKDYIYLPGIPKQKMPPNDLVEYIVSKGFPTKAKRHAISKDQINYFTIIENLPDFKVYLVHSIDTFGGLWLFHWEVYFMGACILCIDNREIGKFLIKSDCHILNYLYNDQDYYSFIEDILNLSKRFADKVKEYLDQAQLQKQ